MWRSICAPVVADALRQSLKREPVTDSAGQPGRGEPPSLNGQTAVMNAAVRVGLVVGLCLGAASPSLAQITYVANNGDKPVSVIETATHALINIIVLGSSPRGQGAAGTPNGLRAYVTNNGNAIVNTITLEKNAFSFRNFVDPSLITGGSEAALTLGFGQFLDFRGGTLQTTASLKAAHTLSLIIPVGTIVTRGFDSTFSDNVIGPGAFTKTGAGFAGIPGPSAVFFGPNEGHDSAVVSAGVSAELTPAIPTYLNYDGQVGREHYDSNAVTGGVSQLLIGVLE
jgi:YVTN family beta-propeller protein